MLFLSTSWDHKGNDVNTELFKKTVERVNIRGKLVASPEIKTLIEKMN